MKHAYFLAFLFLILVQISSAKEIRKVLIIHGSVGMGHTTAAKGVAEDLARRAPGMEVVVKDLRDFLNPITKEPSNKMYDIMTQKFPWLYDQTFRDYMDTGAKVKSLGDMPLVKPFNPKKVLQYIQEVKPDLILSTFPSGTEVIINLRDKGFFGDVPIGWVHTDLVDETYFARFPLQVDKAFVAIPEIQDSWISRGVPADRVLATGMPLNPKVLQTIPKEAVEEFAKSQGLKPGVPTVLILGGSNGVGNYPLMIKSIVKEFGSKEVQIVAVCGRNESHFKNLNKMKVKLGSEVNLVVTKLIPQDDLFKYMELADAIISKTGGLTPMELFYRKKPLILLDINGGQEKYNADIFQKVGLARVTQDQANIGKEVVELMQNSDQSFAQIQKQLGFCESNCPTKIADWIMSSPDPKPVLNIKLDQTPDYPRPQGLFWKCLRALRGH